MRFWLIFLNRIRLFKKHKHLYKIKRSKQVISKIKQISKSSNGYAKAITYLRKIESEVNLLMLKGYKYRIYPTKEQEIQYRVT